MSDCVQLLINYEGMKYRKTRYPNYIANNLCNTDLLGTSLCKPWDRNCQDAVFESRSSILGIKERLEGESTRERAEVSLGDPILGSRRLADSLVFVAGFRDGGRLRLAGSLFLFAFLGNFFDGYAVRFLGLFALLRRSLLE